MANVSDITRNQWMLRGPLAKRGYDWWWHSLTAVHEKTGKHKAFYVEFFTCNPVLAENEPVIVWNDPEARNRGVRPSYLMVNVGHWGKDHAQIHKFYSLKDAEISGGTPFSVNVEDCSMSETHTSGSIIVSEEDVKAHPEWMCDAGSMSWDLEIDKQVAFNVGYGASSLFRKLNSFEMFWHAEGMKTKYRGKIVLNGETYIVEPDSCNGYADKNWGGDFTSPWVWLSSNNLVSRITGKKLNNSVFEIGGGRPKIYFLALSGKLLGEFYYEGKDYEFNFSKFWTGSRTKFRCWETEDKIHWYVKQSTFTSELETEVSCAKDEMLHINYESPDGMKRHNRLWNGGTGEGVLKLYRKHIFGKRELIDEIEAKEIGCEYGTY